MRVYSRLRNDLYCVEWDVKLYYTIPCLCVLVCMCVSLTTQKHCILVCNSTPYQQIKSQQSLNYADLTCAQLLNMFTDVCRPFCQLLL